MGYADTYGKIQKPEDTFDMALKNPNLSSLALAKVLQGSNLFKTTQSNMPQFSGNDRLTQSANTGLGVVQYRNNMKADMGRNNIIADLVKTDMSGKSQLAQEQSRASSAMDIAKLNGTYEAQRIANEKQHYTDQSKQGLIDNNTKLYELGLNVGQKERDNRALLESANLTNQQKNNEIYAQNLIKQGEYLKDVASDDMTPDQKLIASHINEYNKNPFGNFQTQTPTQQAPTTQQAPRLDVNQEKIAYNDALKDFNFDQTKAHIKDGWIEFGDGNRVNAYNYYTEKYKSR